MKWRLITFCAMVLSFFPSRIYAQPPEVPDIDFAAIPGGTFRMGDERGDLWVSCGPVHPVTVSPFLMGRTEITNAQYCVFLNAAWKSKDVTLSKSVVSGANGEYRGKNYLHLSDDFTSFPGNRCRIVFSRKEGFTPMPGYERWPVVCVTWFGAKAFAEYYGWDLPREAEWEYACRGGDQRPYGTGDGTISEAVAKYGETELHPVNVGSYPPNPFGLFDMSGNVWEWCADRYGRYDSGPAVDPEGPAEGSSWRIMRGGGWSDAGERFCRAAVRYYRDPAVRSTALGFRVVKGRGETGKKARIF